MAEVAAAIDPVERRIRAAHPEMRYVFLGAEALSEPARAASSTSGSRESPQAAPPAHRRG